MTVTTANMSLKQAETTDIVNTYAVTNLAAALANIDTHDHSAGKGVPVTKGGATTLASAVVTGAATVGTTLGVTGATTLSSTLGVAGVSTLASAVVTGAATVGTTLGVTGATTLSSTLGVAGVSTLASAVVTAGATIGTSLTVGTTLGVTGTSTLGVVLASAISIGASTIKYPGALGSDQFQLDAAVATDTITLSAGGLRVFSARGVASAVNYVRAVNSVTGSPVLIDAQGTDTNIGITISSKGTGSVAIRPNSLDALTVSGVASAVNGLTVTNAAASSTPSIAATGSDTNIGLDVKTKGTGRVRLFPGGTQHLDTIWDGANISLLPSSGLYIYSADQSKAVIVGNSGVSISGILTTAASASGAAGLNLPHGAAPSSPVNGDMWSTTTGLFIRINGVTKSVNLT